MKGSTFCFCGFLVVGLLFSGVAQAKYDIQAKLEEGQEAYANHDYGTAAKLFRRAALKGSAVAQSLLGLMYASGEGVIKDANKAVTWYRRAADQGHTVAQTSLALMFLKGEGIAQNYAQALVWFQKAAEKGSVDAQYNLGTMYKKGQGVKLDYLQAVDWYEKAAEQGDADAQFNLAIMYKKGQGVNRFYDKSAYWFRKAAEQGHGRAQTSLGVLYVTGNGVKQNFELAVHWYEKAVAQGQKSAQNNLGWLYEKGMGVAKDYDKALLLYSQADNAWSKHRHASLSEKINCLATSKTRLFMTALKCADRDGLMTAIKEGGAQVKTEDKGNWGDIYLTSSQLFGTSELYVAYTNDDRFALARYTFGGKRDLTMVSKVKDIVSGSYGEPDSTKGEATQGKVSYTWMLTDGITLEVTRGWPDTTTAMTYLYPAHYQVMKKEQKEQDSAQGKRYRTQSTQF